MRAFHTGTANKAIGATKMNAVSSRSHTLLCLKIESVGIDGRDKKCSKLWIVDLAGSEKSSKTEAEGMRLEEAKTINGSLTTLGLVI
jgi:hypothetical protein